MRTVKIVADSSANVMQLQKVAFAVAPEMGKGVQTDAVKNTFVRIYGLSKCEELVQKYTDMALDALNVFENTEYMVQLAKNLTERRV